MITPADIIISERKSHTDFTDFTREITARLDVRNVVRLSEFALQSSRETNEARRISYDRAARGVWDKVYGDLGPELHQLRTAVRRGLGHFSPAEFYEINE